VMRRNCLASQQQLGADRPRLATSTCRCSSNERVAYLTVTDSVVNVGSVHQIDSKIPHELQFGFSKLWLVSVVFAFLLENSAVLVGLLHRSSPLQGRHEPTRATSSPAILASISWHQPQRDFYGRTKNGMMCSSSSVLIWKTEDVSPLQMFAVELRLGRLAQCKILHQVRPLDQD
jgi:hypothetical protein